MSRPTIVIGSTSQQLTEFSGESLSSVILCAVLFFRGSDMLQLDSVLWLAVIVRLRSNDSRSDFHGRLCRYTAYQLPEFGLCFDGKCLVSDGDFGEMCSPNPQIMRLGSPQQTGKLFMRRNCHNVYNQRASTAWRCCHAL
jgi:hypothetical protein